MAVVNDKTTKPNTTKTFVACVGINFDGLTDKPRVEVDQPIPAGLSDKELIELLEMGAIKEA